MNCKVCGNNSTKETSVSFFRFPKDVIMCREWAKRCGLLSLFKKDGTTKFYKSYRICSDHFHPKDVVFVGRKKRLLESAMPSIVLPKNNSKDEKPRIMRNLKQNEVFKLVENLCRLCAKESENLTEIYGYKGRFLKLEEKLKYLPLMITEYDILPLRVCCLCLCKLNQLYDFIQNCKKAETKMKIMCALEDCNMTHKIKQASDEFEKFYRLTKLNKEFNKTQDFGLLKSSNLESCPQENSKKLSDHSNEDNFKNEQEKSRFRKQSEPEFLKVNQITNHIYFIKKSEYSINNSRHDHSFMESRNQCQNTENETDTNQKVVEETKQSCKIFLKVISNTVVSNTQSVTNTITSNSATETICLPSKNIFFKRSSKNHPKSNEKTHSRCIVKIDQKKSGSSAINQRITKNKGYRKCQFCDRLFMNSQFCLKHEKTHTGKTPYECVRIRTKPSLWQHKYLHLDNRAHECQRCGMSFKRKDSLITHFRMHTGERPYVCRLCGLAFKKKGDCIKHEKNHDDTTVAEVEEKNSQLQIRSTVLRFGGAEFAPQLK